MTATPPPPADLATRLRRLAQAGHDLATQIERGLGDGPLTRHFAQLGDDLQSGPFRCVLLGLDPATRGQALGLLSGQDFHVLRLQIPDEVGLVDVRFGERGYVLEGRGGDRRQFDHLEPFLAAVQQADLVRDGDASAFLAPMTLQIQGPQGVQGLHLLLPESLTALHKNPRLLGRLTAHGNLLVVAGAAATSLRDSEVQALRELAEAMPVVLPLVFAEGPLPKHGFWNDRSLLPCRDLLPPLVAVPGEVPGFAKDARDPLRGAARAAQHASKLRTAVAMAKAELVEDRGQVDVRLKNLQREQKALDEGQRERDLRGQVDALRVPALDQLRTLSDQSGEDLRRLGIAGGPIESVCGSVVEQVQAADLERSPLGSNKVRLGVGAEVLERCRRALYEELARATKAQAVLLREGAGALEARLAQGLSGLRQASVSVRLPSFDEERTRHGIKELLQSDLEAKAEIDRRSFWKRLAHGRQLVFTILMTISLFGSVLPFGRDQVMQFVVPLFVLGVVMTVFSFRREDRERVDKELERMREQLRNQLQQRGRDGLRELGERVRRHVDDLKERMSRQIDAIAKETEQQLVQKARDGGKDLQQKAKVQDQRRRDLDGLLQRIGELERQCGEVERDAASALQQLARQAVAPGSVTASRPASGGKP